MKVMVLVKATQDSEAGVMPTQELLTAMGEFNASLVKAGILLAGEGLKPSRHGKRVRFSGKTRTVTDGPFAETKDLIAGWMVIDVDTYERALELAAELSAAPGAGGKPIHEWLEVRPFLAAPPTITE